MSYERRADSGTGGPVGHSPRTCGRTQQKLAKIGGQFGCATTTDLDAVITDPSVDLVDIWR